MAQTPVGTAFTYQGRLLNAGAPSTGTFDFQFTLFDAETGGTSVTLTIAKDDVAVAGGLFNVDLDFGEAAFDGDARWLEIAVRPGASTGAFTTLAPRTRLQPTPYSVHASAADSVGGIAGSDLLSRVRSFVVASGQTVQAGQAVSFSGGAAEIQPGYDFGLNGFGSAQIFRNATTDSIAAVALSPTRIVVAYLLGGAAHAMVGEISGDSILFGPEASYSTVGINAVGIAICALSPTSVFVATSYADLVGFFFHHKMGVAAATVSGNALSFGPEVIADVDVISLSPSPLYTSLAVTSLSPTQAFLAYTRLAATGSLIRATISGVTSSVTGPTTFNPSNTESIALATLSPTQFVIAYRDTGNVTLGTAIVASFVSTTLTLGPETIFNTGSTDRVSVDALASDQFVVSYRDVGNANRGSSVVGSVTGNTPTFGAEAVFNTGATGPTSTRAVGPGAFVVAYTDETNSFFGTLALGKVSGNSISFSPENVFNPAATMSLSAAVPSASSVVVAYKDGGNNNVGTARVGHLRPSTLVGVARGSGAAGASVPVTLLVNHSISDTHTGLTPGASYFAQPDGSITTSDFGLPLGVAISPTEILFTP